MILVSLVVTHFLVVINYYRAYSTMT